MSGRPKQKCYQYDSSGKFIKVYDSNAEVLGKYFSHIKGKRPLFISYTKEKIYRKDYIVLPDNTFLTKARIGREGIRDIKKRIGNPFLKPSNTVIDVYNLDNELVASFNGLNIASNLCNIPKGTIYSQLTKSVNKAAESNSSGLLFKYRNNGEIKS